MKHEAVLFANEAFYRAFADRDLDAMDALWARDLPVACVHPGWGALTNRAAVLESWRGILGSDRAPNILCRSPHPSVLGDTAIVICFEVIDGAFLIATNVFAREDGAWKLVHHQAGPTAERPHEQSATESVVH